MLIEITQPSTSSFSFRATLFKKKKGAQNEIRKILYRFSYSKNMENFEELCWAISSGIDIFYLKSDEAVQPFGEIVLTALSRVRA